MDMDKAKLFVGGISRGTSDEILRLHFGKYGTVLGSLVAKDKSTKIPRGFGFVWFSDPAFADRALKDSHVILGKTVEVKKAIPKSEQFQFQLHQHQPQQLLSQQKNSWFNERSSSGNGNDCFSTKKIFVGGLSSNLTEEQFKNYFEKFGKIVDVVVMQDSSTNRPRGFGFVTFDSEESVEKVMRSTYHDLNGRLVEVKRAVPKEGISGNNGYVSRGGVRGSSTSCQPGNRLPYGHCYEILPSYVLTGYNGFGGYLYGTSIYGSYPTVAHGIPFGVVPIAPRNHWNGHTMIGATLYPSPYNDAFPYPAYMNGHVSFAGMMMSGRIGFAESSGSGKQHEVSGGSGYLLVDAALPPTEGMKLGLYSSGSNNRNRII